MLDLSELRTRAEHQLGVPSTLHNYQWEGITHLYQSRAALLADEMGLGKTVQTAVALALLLSGPNDVRRALIVAPASLTENWMRELAIWAPSLTVRRLQGAARAREAFYLLPIPVLIGSYEQIRLDGLDRIPSKTFDLVILDEAQRIKNRASATTLACRLLPRKRAWALSATPLENDRDDIISILSFLDPSVSPHLSHARLAHALGSIMLRRRKSTVRSELPPVIFEDLTLELSPPQRERYAQLWSNRSKGLPSDLSGTEINTILLGLITRLKIICNYDASTDCSTKLDALRIIIEGAGESARILVFSQFVGTLRWIGARIDLPCDLLIGSMTPPARQAAIDRFRTAPSPRILLVSLRAGGVGLNLGESTHVIVFDRWWNPAVETQAIYRAHRFDRDTPLHVIRFLVADSIEERIAHLLEQKQWIFDEVVESAEPKTLNSAQLMRILELAGTAVPPISTSGKEDRLDGKDR